MNKKIATIIIIALAAGIVFAFWFGYNRGFKKGGAEGYNQGYTKGKAAAEAETAKKAGAAVSNPLENAPSSNPFEANVNPFEGYKNPFK